MVKQRVIHKATQYLDGEKLFRTYFITMGVNRSFSKLVDYCIKEGMVNRLTHRPPNRMSIWAAMWNWAIKPENQKKAYDIYQQYMLDNGQFCSEKEWEELLDRTARNVLEEKRYDRWAGNVPASPR